MSDDDLGYARKEDEDRTLYLRRTGFGRAGRDILSSRAVDAAGGAADPLRASSDREERGGLIAPRYGAQGAPPQTLQTLQRAHQKDARSPPFGGGGGFLDDSMDDLDEQNFGDSFDSPPRDRGGRDRGGDSSGGGKQADEQQQPAVVKMVKKAVLPPPKMPPPRGARPLHACRHAHVHGPVPLQLGLRAHAGDWQCALSKCARCAALARRALPMRLK